MKSTLLMDEKDIEENILIIEKQIHILNNISILDLQTSNHTDHSLKIISSTA
jgi:hypothetical protein